MSTLEGIFIQGLYNKILFRNPSQSELDAFVSRLSLGTATRDQLRIEITNSAEYSTNVAAVARLYLDVLGRGPDAAGMQFWVNALNNALGTSAPGSAAFTAARQNVLTSISTQFAASAEATSRGLDIASPSNTTFVEAVYTSALGRPSDTAGLAFWVGQLNSGAATRGTVIQFFTESAENRAQEIGETTGYALLRSFDNVNPLIAQLDAFLDTATTQEVLTAASAVGGTTNVPSGPGTTNNVGGSTGQVFNLTTNLDAVTGTNFDDTFSAAQGNLNSFDTLKGGAGTDTLFATLNAVVTPNVSAIENINFTVSGAATYSFLNTTGATNVSVDGATAGVTLQDAPAGLKYTLSNFTTAAGGAPATIALLDSAGIADAITVNLSRFGTATNQQAVTLNGFETITFNTQSLPSVIGGGGAGGLTATNVQTINVTGNQNLTLIEAAASNFLTKVDASTFTGALTLTTINNTAITVTGGTGNDRFTIANLATTDIINGGAGTDTLVAANGTGAGLALTGGTISNIENLEVQSTTAGSTVTVTASAIGITALSTTNNTAAVTFNSVTAGTPLSVRIADANNDGAEEAGGITYNLTTTVGSADAMTLSLDAGGIAGGVPPANVQNVALTAAGIENVTIDSINTGLSVNAATNNLNLTAAAQKTVTITGNTALVFSTTALVGTTVDGSAATGALTYLLGAAAQNVKGGTANDTINFQGNLAAGDVVDGGAGTDTIQSTDVTTVTGITVTNVETFRHNETDAGNNTITATHIGSIANYQFNDTGGAAVTTFAALPDAPVFTILGDTGQDGTLTATLASDTLANSISLTASDLLPAVNNLLLGTLTIAQFETATLAATDNFDINTLTGTALTKLTITGAGTVDLGSTAMTTGTQFTLDASAATGGITTKVSGGLVNLVYSGSAGIDTIDLSGLTLTSNIQSINGSTGADVLAIKTNGIVGGLTITDVETIVISNITGASTINGSGITSSGATTIVVDDNANVAFFAANDSSATLTLGTATSRLGAGVTSVDASGTDVAVNAAYTSAANHLVQVAGPGAASGTINFSATTANTVTFGATTTAATTLTVVNFGTDDKINLPGAATFQVLTGGALAAAGDILVQNDGFGNTTISYTANADADAVDAGDFIITLQGVQLAGQLTAAGNFIS